jgi:hypothetical protein
MPGDFADRTDFDNANRRLVAQWEPAVVKAADGRVVYDADVFVRTTSGNCPDGVRMEGDAQGLRHDRRPHRPTRGRLRDRHPVKLARLSRGRS